jgi:tRNA(His) 5'-end guanylyltransferase
MKFDELDRRMRVYETHSDYRVLPGLWMVARVDGRSFTQLTRKAHPFEAPYDERFRDMMLATAEHLMQAGMRVLYAYTQSDEISLLLHHDEQAFGRKTRKLISVLAGEASAKFSLLLGAVAAFDARVSELPSQDLVIDYFRWRQEDAHRNALNGHSYWALRRKGQSAQEATQALEGLSGAQKNELLFQNGIQFNDLPAWHRRGMGLLWCESSEGRAIHRELELPMRDAYDAFLRDLLLDGGVRST